MSLVACGAGTVARLFCIEHKIKQKTYRRDAGQSVGEVDTWAGIAAGKAKVSRRSFTYGSVRQRDTTDVSICVTMARFRWGEVDHYYYNSFITNMLR